MRADIETMPSLCTGAELAANVAIVL